MFAEFLSGATFLTLVAALTADLPDVDQLPSNPKPPDVLRMLDGKPVATPADWIERRRPELKALFERYVYGVAPPPPKIATFAKRLGVLGDGSVELIEVDISFPELPPNAPKIHLAVFLPSKRTGPVPVFLALNSRGNQTVLADGKISQTTSVLVDKRPSNRGSDVDFWCVPTLVARGYAFATFHESDIDPDRNDFTDGIHPFYPNLPGPKEAHWGTIRAWAWGLSRGADALERLPEIDRTRICVTGHSRRGKTALLAGAFDERFALVVPHQSGTGGCALSRNNKQETVERITRVFPHWFAKDFRKFAGKEDRLPVDQHLLIALVAPRPVFDTEGEQDAWANFDSAYEACRLADPAWKLLGAGGMGLGRVKSGDPWPPEEPGALLQMRLDSKHLLNEAYWRRILDFADVQWSRRGKSPTNLH